VTPAITASSRPGNLASEGGQLALTLVAGGDETGLAQHAEMVGGGRFGHTRAGLFTQGGARKLRLPVERRHHA